MTLQSLGQLGALRLGFSSSSFLGLSPSTRLSVQPRSQRSMAASFLRFPPPAFAGVDAAATLNGTVYFWWNGVLSWVDPVVNEWQTLDEPVSHVEAASEFGHARRVLLFAGSQFWMFDLLSKRLVSNQGSPVGLDSQWFPLDAASYNATESLIYFFKNRTYCTAQFDGSAFSSVSVPSDILWLAGSGFSVDWPNFSAAGAMPGANGTRFFIRDLKAVLSSDGEVVATLSSLRSSACQKCLCSSTEASGCSPANGIKVGVAECVVDEAVAQVCVDETGQRPYHHAGQRFAQCLQCECAGPCGANGTCIPRSPFCYDANGQYVVAGQAAACTPCPALCVGQCSRASSDLVGGVSVIWAGCLLSSP